MTQEQRDLAYEVGRFVPGGADYPARWQSAAADFRAATPCELDLPYGENPRARYDLFLPEGASRGLMVFVHGGYWKSRCKSEWSHFAAGGLARGYSVAIVGYPLAPEVRISEITAHIAAAIAAAAARVAGPIVLAGHSAGGHLAARMAMPGVLPPELAERLTRVMPISPLSDLRPFLDLGMNADLRLDAAEAGAESPVLGKPLEGVGVVALVGSEERPVFLDQNRWLAEAWGCDEVILPGRHHFDVIDGLADPDSVLMRAYLGED
ncbi:MAG: alpha/beta hydrolase [Litoreibacter sp.]|nr:alpha/beta hydrolase [Litoreibacter sp.]